MHFVFVHEVQNYFSFPEIKKKMPLYSCLKNAFIHTCETQYCISFGIHKNFIRAEYFYSIS